MKQAVIDHVGKLLAEGRISAFLGVRQQGDYVEPYLFTSPEELSQLSLGDREGPGDSRYPLVKLLRPIAESNPNDTLGVLVRGCDERALEQLMRDSIYKARKVVPVGIACPAELAQAHECGQPWPRSLVAGQPVAGVEPSAAPLADPVSSMEDWHAILDRCVKCFGCRNVCPVCSCKECTVEEEAFIPQAELPASRSFLLTRAVHMVDRCVYCGLCEEACPADIPLKQLYRMVAALMGRQAGPSPLAVPGSGRSAS